MSFSANDFTSPYESYVKLAQESPSVLIHMVDTEIEVSRLALMAKALGFATASYLAIVSESLVKLMEHSSRDVRLRALEALEHLLVCHPESPDTRLSKLVEAFRKTQ